MRSSIHSPSSLKVVLGLWGSLVVLCPIVCAGWSSRGAAGSGPVSAGRAFAAAPAAPLSVEQLAQRLRAMEEMNRKLAEQIGETKRRTTNRSGSSSGESTIYRLRRTTGRGNRRRLPSRLTKLSRRRTPLC